MMFKLEEEDSKGEKVISDKPDKINIMILFMWMKEHNKVQT